VADDAGKKLKIIYCTKFARFIPIPRKKIGPGLKSPRMMASANQGCQIFLGATANIYQMTRKYTKWPQFIPNVCKIDRHLPLQVPSKIYRNWDFWFKNMYTIWQPCS
jgi:hypothetical protein